MTVNGFKYVSKQDLLSELAFETQLQEDATSSMGSTSYISGICFYNPKEQFQPLTNTSWVCNSTVALPDNGATYTLNFSCSGTNFTNMQFATLAGGGKTLTFFNGGLSVVAYTSSVGWL